MNPLGWIKRRVLIYFHYYWGPTVACCILSFIYGVESDVLQPFHGDMSFSHQDEGLKPPLWTFLPGDLSPSSICWSKKSRRYDVCVCVLLVMLHELWFLLLLLLLLWSILLLVCCDAFLVAFTWQLPQEHKWNFQEDNKILLYLLAVCQPIGIKQEKPGFSVKMLLLYMKCIRA